MSLTFTLLAYSGKEFTAMAQHCEIESLGNVSGITKWILRMLYWEISSVDRIRFKKTTELFNFVTFSTSSVTSSEILVSHFIALEFWCFHGKFKTWKRTWRRFIYLPVFFLSCGRHSGLEVSARLFLIERFGFESRDPFLQGPEDFSHPKSRSKISNLISTEMFQAHILILPEALFIQEAPSLIYTLSL